MKTVKDKYIVVGADFAGFPLKEAVVAHLEKKGWKVTDLGVRADSDPNDTDLCSIEWACVWAQPSLRANLKEHCCSAVPAWASTLL